MSPHLSPWKVSRSFSACCLQMCWRGTGLRGERSHLVSSAPPCRKGCYIHFVNVPEWSRDKPNEYRREQHPCESSVLYVAMLVPIRLNSAHCTVWVENPISCLPQQNSNQSVFSLPCILLNQLGVGMCPWCALDGDIHITVYPIGQSHRCCTSLRTSNHLVDATYPNLFSLVTFLWK